MRSVLIGVLLFLSAASSFAQGTAAERVYTRQELFVSCLSGYVNASVPQGETPGHDESVRLAAQILSQVHKVCTAPSPQLTEKNFTDPDAFLYPWMLMVTRELVVLARQGASQQMLERW